MLWTWLGRNAGALALARTALEHHLLDRLLFLANRWLSTYGGIKERDMPREEARLAALKAGPRPDIVRSWRDKEGRVNVLVRGVFPQGEVGKGPTLSPYYFPVDRYDPFTGHKRARQPKSPGAGLSGGAAPRRWFSHRLPNLGRCRP